MTLAEAYEKACSRGHQADFCSALYAGLSKRMSEQDAINHALQKIESIPTQNNLAISKMVYATAFQKALDDGADEGQARMIALRTAKERRGG